MYGCTENSFRLSQFPILTATTRFQQADCGPGLLDEREVLPGDTWCVTRYGGPQSQARSRAAEVLRSQVPVFGPLSCSRAAERYRAAPSGVLGSDVGRWFPATATELCLVVSQWAEMDWENYIVIDKELGLSGKELKKWIDEQQIEERDILAGDRDASRVAHEQEVARLTAEQSARG
ncbi:hypothetical protein HPB50_007499 [Hyalomma asiaticum]|uniref:Uncharacterized protein n=1 Tax=Hyalomma asiaticum TaxID=266040 RepID=A0ACB7RTH2_HYAAI|nr:hypothetical protein HPB50_007499 [Hyalomma asiaticum]